MKLIIEDLGRDKWNGIINIPDNSNAEDIAEFAYKEAKKHLATRYPDTEYDTTTNQGEISAGYRIVGKFHIEKEG